MRIERIPDGANERGGVAGWPLRAAYGAASPQADPVAAILLLAARIDNFDALRVCYGDGVAAEIAAAVRSFFQSRFDDAVGMVGGVIRRGAAEFDIVARGSAGCGLLSVRPEYERIKAWFAACARVPVRAQGSSVHIALSWACVETDTDYDDDEVLNLLLLEARGGIPRQQQLPPVGGEVSDLLARDMAAAATLYAELNAAALQFAWRPVRSLDSDAVLFLRACIAAPGNGGQIETRDLAYRSLERLGVVQAFDQAMVAQAIEHLAHSDSHSVCVPVSSLSFRATGWWDAVLSRLAGDRALASRLFIALDCTQSFVVASEAVDFADRLYRLGCRIVLEGLGSGQIAIATLMALRPHVVTLDSLFLRLSSRREPDEQLFRRIVGLASSLAPVVVVEGVDDHERALLAADAGAHWGAGDYLGQASWRGPSRAKQRAAQTAAFSVFSDPFQRKQEGPR